MLAQSIAWFFSHFSLSMLLLALIISLFFTIFSSITLSKAIFRWVALLAVGLTGIYTFVVHAFFPAISAANIGWAMSPFQYEVAIADLTVGILGIFAFHASRGFRMATVIAATVWMWGDAYGHIHQMISNHNFAPGNAGSWFWMDVVIPIILIMAFLKMKQYDIEHGNHYSINLRPPQSL